jgi:hypothetical protein
MSPRSLIPSTFVNNEPGGSNDENTPSWSRNPWRTVAEATLYHPTIVPLLLIDPRTVKLEPG